jgi:hypothetical protein
MGANAAEEHVALATNLDTMAFENLPIGIANKASAAHLKMAQQHARSMDKNQAVLAAAPLDISQWFQWLDNGLQSDSPLMTEATVVAVVEHLDSIAANEVWLRLSMARLGLVEWYQLSPAAREAFRRHLDWMASYNVNMLWGHARLVRRDALLCRIYARDNLALPLC